MHNALHNDRERLLALDLKLVDLIAEREALIESIGKRKMELGLPVYQSGVEQSKLDKIERRALFRGLDISFVNDLWLKFFIRSKQLQRQYRIQVKRMVE